MNNTGEHKSTAEPDLELVERAIVKLLELAQRKGITAADFIQMLDSGMQMSDFLNALELSANADHNFYSDTRNARSTFIGSHDA